MRVPPCIRRTGGVDLHNTNLRVPGRYGGRCSIGLGWQSGIDCRQRNKTKKLGQIPSLYLAVHPTRARRRARTERRHLKKNGVYKHLTCGERASNGERFYFRARPLAHEKKEKEVPKK